MGDERLRIALTLGDPRGIGPEVVARAAVEHAEAAQSAGLLIVGPDGMDPEVPDVGYLAVGAWDGSERGAGRMAGVAVERAVALALAGDVAGIVTGPIHKPAFQAAGYDFPGHTELLRARTRVERVGMLMAAERLPSGGSLRVLLATTHLPLRDVPSRFTADLLVEQTRLLDQALRMDWGVAEPSIALCAFNPHASDGGLFGDEEVRVYAPALDRLADEGVAATGPIPADTVFHRTVVGEFDAVVAPYHDVGMAAFKTASFGRGVNVTLGLPFVRTSPDHGTAMDLAGTGRADPSSAREALRLAVQLAHGRAARDRAARTRGEPAETRRQL